MHKTLPILLLLLLSKTYAQFVHIPDPLFKEFLTSSSNNYWGFFPSRYDKNGDKEIDFDEAKQIKEIDFGGRYSFKYRNITDLTGVEHFENLEHLDCAFNKIKILNLKNLKKLAYLNAHFNFNFLTRIDVSGCSSLETLYAGSNPITELHFQGANSLKKMILPFNSLENVDMSELTNLEEIDLSNGQLKSVVFGEHLKINQINLKNNPTLQSLNLTGMVGLKNLDVSFCGLKDVNIQNLPNLENLSIQNNQLTELDLTGVINLKIFNCSNNSLKSLRVNHLKQMNQLDCSYNKIKELDLMNMGWNLSYVNCNDNLLQKLMVNNTILNLLEVSNNLLEVLDVSWQKGLGYLNLKNNRLIHLNIQNSDSNLPSNGGLDLSGNPNLSFICTDDFVVNAYKMYLSNANIQNVKVSEKCYFKPIVTPNPVFEDFQITSMRQMKTVRIYNVNGTLIHESHPGTYQADFNNLSNITKGLFLVEVTDVSGEVNTVKLMAN